MNSRKFLTLILLLGMLPAAAQEPREADVEVFCGAELKYADVNFIRLYDLLIYLTPGVKWHMGNDWMLAAQAQIPIFNNGYFDYTPDGRRYEMTRLSNVSISKELHFEQARQHLKLSAGLFNQERWGADVKWMMPLNSWLLLNAQGGLTRHWAIGTNFGDDSESQFNGRWLATGQAGANVFLDRWNTEFRLSGGRYINKDWGFELDVMRHFRHCTVLAYAQLHKRGEDYARHREAGGFILVMMLPPYDKKLTSRNGRVVFRPASNFRFTYNAQSDGVSMGRYVTDPEENERELPVRVSWGLGGASNQSEK